MNTRRTTREASDLQLWGGQIEREGGGAVFINDVRVKTKENLYFDSLTVFVR